MHLLEVLTRYWILLVVLVVALIATVVVVRLRRGRLPGAGRDLARSIRDVTKWKPGDS